MIEKYQILSDLSLTQVEGIMCESFIIFKFLFKIILEHAEKSYLKGLEVFMLDEILRQLFEISTNSI